MMQDPSTSSSSAQINSLSIEDTNSFDPTIVSLANDDTMSIYPTDSSCFSPTICTYTKPRQRCKACLTGWHDAMTCFFCGQKVWPADMACQVNRFNQINGDAPPPGYIPPPYRPGLYLLLYLILTNSNQQLLIVTLLKRNILFPTLPKRSKSTLVQVSILFLLLILTKHKILKILTQSILLLNLLSMNRISSLIK